MPAQKVVKLDECEWVGFRKLKNTPSGYDVSGFHKGDVAPEPFVYSSAFNALPSKHDIAQLWHSVALLSRPCLAVELAMLEARDIVEKYAEAKDCVNCANVGGSCAMVAPRVTRKPLPLVETNGARTSINLAKLDRKLFTTAHTKPQEFRCLWLQGLPAIVNVDGGVCGAWSPLELKARHGCRQKLCQKMLFVHKLQALLSVGPSDGRGPWFLEAH
ncbi:hypothetical protein BC835DRAFT_1309860 [Cytidiella melzeri]|nr:hypothetical protein BC835DRAFT_1309860 [Cytidiella melzeri]